MRLGCLGFCWSRSTCFFLVGLKMANAVTGTGESLMMTARTLGLASDGVLYMIDTPIEYVNVHSWFGFAVFLYIVLPHNAILLDTVDTLLTPR